jgi:hypothetical protein
MTQMWFPGLTFNGAALVRGQLLDVSLLGVGIVIPPWDITLLPAITFWDSFLIFDSDWVVNALSGALLAIPKAVWDYLMNAMQAQVDEYKKAHPEGEKK